MSEAKLAHLACTFVLPAVAAVAAVGLPANLYHFARRSYRAVICALAGTDDELS